MYWDEKRWAEALWEWWRSRWCHQ
uniref:Uncharacterized protein n=1 Tax=Arundo donax TaxID=35708 RepID=A0A0A9BUH4_ARUDO